MIYILISFITFCYKSITNAPIFSPFLIGMIVPILPILARANALFYPYRNDRAYLWLNLKISLETRSYPQVIHNITMGCG